MNSKSKTKNNNCLNLPANTHVHKRHMFLAPAQTYPIYTIQTPCKYVPIQGVWGRAGPVVCLYRGWAEGVHVQSVTQILVAPVKVGATACVTHHCRAFFFTRMLTRMVTKMVVIKFLDPCSLSRISTTA